MSLQRNIGLPAAEDTDHAIKEAADAESLRAQQRTAGHGDQPGGKAIEFMNRERALAFPTPPRRRARRGPRGRRAQLHPREQPAEIAPPLLRRTKHGQAEAIGLRHSALGGHLNCEFGPNQRADPRSERSLMKARRTRHAIAIEQRNGRIPKRRGPIDEHFGERGRTEKTERGGSMKLDVRRHRRQPQRARTTPS